jgi:hypothetical protein
MKNLLALTLITGFLMACAGEPKATVKAEDLVGRWMLKEAFRNDEQIESMSDLYFNFSAEGSMETNMPNAEGNSKYTLSGNTIEQLNEQVKLQYTVETLTSTNLVLSTTIENFEFRFSMEKTE